MSSEAKRAANRQNAKKSTGPRSAAGKMRSRYNALRHGLASVEGGDSFSGQIRPLVENIIAISGASPGIAYAVAKARIELIRARQATIATIDQAVAGQAGGVIGTLSTQARIGLAVAAKASELARITRYERRAWSRLKRILTQLEHETTPALAPGGSNMQENPSDTPELIVTDFC